MARAQQAVLRGGGRVLLFLAAQINFKCAFAGMKLKMTPFSPQL